VAGQSRGTRPDTSAERAAEMAELKRYATYQLVGAVLGRARRSVARLIEALFGRGRATAPVEARHLLDGSLLEVQRAIDARFEAEGMPSATARKLRQRAMAVAGQALANLDGTADAASRAPQGDTVKGYVQPETAAWVALGVLGASGVVRPGDPSASPPQLRQVLWPWVEPPVLARTPSLRIARAAARRLLAGMLQRARRRKSQGS
jgi:hypothetical protein